MQSRSSARADTLFHLGVHSSLICQTDDTKNGEEWYCSIILLGLLSFSTIVCVLFQKEKEELKRKAKTD